MSYLLSNIILRILKYIRLDTDHPLVEHYPSIARLSPYWKLTSNTDVNLLPRKIFSLKIDSKVILTDVYPINVNFIICTVSTLFIQELISCQTIILYGSLHYSRNDLMILSRVNIPIILANEFFTREDLVKILQRSCSNVLYIQTHERTYNVCPRGYSKWSYIYQPLYQIYYDSEPILTQLLQVFSTTLEMDLLDEQWPYNSYYGILVESLQVDPELKISFDSVNLINPTGNFLNTKVVTLVHDSSKTYMARALHINCMSTYSFEAPCVERIYIHRRMVLPTSERTASDLFEQYPTLKFVSIKQHSGAYYISYRN